MNAQETAQLIIDRAGPAYKVAETHGDRYWRLYSARQDALEDGHDEDSLVMAFINRERVILNIQEWEYECMGRTIKSQCTANELADRAKAALGTFRFWTEGGDYNCDWQWNESTGGDRRRDLNRSEYMREVAEAIMGCDCPVEQWYRDND